MPENCDCSQTNAIFTKIQKWFKRSYFSLWWQAIFHEDKVCWVYLAFEKRPLKFWFQAFMQWPWIYPLQHKNMKNAIVVYFVCHPSLFVSYCHCHILLHVALVVLQWSTSICTSILITAVVNVSNNLFQTLVRQWVETWYKVNGIDYNSDSWKKTSQKWFSMLRKPIIFHNKFMDVIYTQ